MTQLYDPPHHKTRRTQWAPLAVVATAAVIGALTVTIVLTTRSSHSVASTPFHPKNPLAETSTTCNTGTLADKNKTLIIDMAGEKTATGTSTIDDVLCVLTDLETPQSVIARMESTRALDGMQSATWSTYEVTWTYHPDDGLDLIITNKN
jgi:hypothetical protein